MIIKSRWFLRWITRLVDHQQISSKLSSQKFTPFLTFFLSFSRFFFADFFMNFFWFFCKLYSQFFPSLFLGLENLQDMNHHHHGRINLPPFHPHSLSPLSMPSLSPSSPSSSSSPGHQHHGNSTTGGSGHGFRGMKSKICGVCGDRAKSYHFGGISCDSCKGMALMMISLLSLILLFSFLWNSIHLYSYLFLILILDWVHSISFPFIGSFQWIWNQILSLSQTKCKQTLLIRWHWPDLYINRSISINTLRMRLDTLHPHNSC